MFHITIRLLDLIEIRPRLKTMNFSKHAPTQLLSSTSNIFSKNVSVTEQLGALQTYHSVEKTKSEREDRGLCSLLRWCLRSADRTV